MQVERILVEIERLIERGIRQSVGEKYWRDLFSAELEGVRTARAHMGEAVNLGKDPLTFVRAQLGGMVVLPDWSSSQALFERSVARRMGYEEAVDALVRSRSEERVNPRRLARTVRDRSGLDLDP